MTAPILELHDIHKSFGGVHALRGANFAVAQGEVVALVGDNGAGKSTLVKTIAGVHQPDSGVIVFDGQEVTMGSPQDACRLGIETVYQDLALCDNLDIVANMYLGREAGRNLLGFPFGRLARALSQKAMAERAAQVMSELAVTTVSDIHVRVASLSGGQRQAVAIARAVMWNSKVVVLDEPTAALGVPQRAEVLALIKRLRSQGLGVVVISHDLNHVFEVSDRIEVLRFGQRVLSTPTADTTPTDVIHAMTGAKTAEETLPHA